MGEGHRFCDVRLDMLCKIQAVCVGSCIRYVVVADEAMRCEHKSDIVIQLRIYINIPAHGPNILHSLSPQPQLPSTMTIVAHHAVVWCIVCVYQQ